MPRRILILSASVGAGHVRAAEAVELAVKELDPTAAVENVDVLTLTNAVFRRVYGQAYLDLANKLPPQYAGQLQPVLAMLAKALLPVIALYRSASAHTPA